MTTCSCLTRAQTVKINFISFNPCNSTYEHEILCSLFKGGIEYKIADTLGTIFLPSTGKYKLTLQFPEHYSVSDSIVVSKSGQNYDTLKKAKIIEWQHSMNSSAYWCCDRLCNGYNVDYYENGNKRMEGNFISGQPIGEFTVFYSNGEPKEVRFYDMDGKGILKGKQQFVRQTPR